MKKNLLTLGIAAAVGSLGFSSPALAQEQATSLKISPTGKGHMLIVPYYTVQSGNATLLNIVNSDKLNGKAVKLRFRGAANADSVFDFTLLLGPGDVWAAEVSQNPGTGFARLYTPDNSCTMPPMVNPAPVMASRKYLVLASTRSRASVDCSNRSSTLMEAATIAGATLLENRYGRAFWRRISTTSFGPET